MENASKAIIIAGSMLIALIIISLVVLLFQQLSNIQREQDSALSAEQMAEFNKKFELYNTNLYGSELLSLANLIEDYEYRQEVIDDLNKITVKVKFDKTCVNQLDGAFEKEKEYDLLLDILPKYVKIHEKDSRLVTFKRIGFRKVKVEYNGPQGRISYLEFKGEGMSDSQWDELQKILGHF